MACIVNRGVVTASYTAEKKSRGEKHNVYVIGDGSS
jgi:hypothetical protein